ncbi:hypothetical protein, partial [Salmonella sp. s57402]|uniref:hypothetical protein n=1 Tax=Salmonella sp. s57402 TaxID=3159695 RepID=UPI00397F5C04
MEVHQFNFAAANVTVAPPPQRNLKKRKLELTIGPVKKFAGIGEQEVAEKIDNVSSSVGMEAVPEVS